MQHQGDISPNKISLCLPYQVSYDKTCHPAPGVHPTNQVVFKLTDIKDIRLTAICRRQNWYALPYKRQPVSTYYLVSLITKIIGLDTLFKGNTTLLSANSNLLAEAILSARHYPSIYP